MAAENLTQDDKKFFEELTAIIHFLIERYPTREGVTAFLHFKLSPRITENHPLVPYIIKEFDKYQAEMSYNKDTQAGATFPGRYKLTLTKTS